MKFRKRPVVIEAIQWTGKNWKEIEEFVNVRKSGVHAWIGGDLIIPTLEGNMSATPGDWIIKGVRGEFYPCKPDIFAQTYEQAEVK